MISSTRIFNLAGRRLLALASVLAASVLAFALVVAAAGPAQAATGSLGSEGLGAQADEIIYFSDAEDSGVASVPAGGGEVTEYPGDWLAPRGIAVFEDTMYVANAGNRVDSAPLGGAGTSELTGTDLSGAFGVALSSDGKFLYVAEANESRVSRVSTDDGEISHLSIPGLDRPKDIAISGGLLYIADGDNDRVVSAPINGGAPTELVTGVGGTTGVAVHGNTLYISDWSDDKVVSAPISGGAVTDLVTDLNGPRGLAVSGDTIYIADALNDRVVSAPISGGPVTELATGIDYPDSVAIGAAPCSGSSCLPVVGSLFGSLG